MCTCNQNSLASLLHRHLFSNDAFSDARAEQPITHMRLQQLQITLIQQSKQFPMDKTKSHPLFLC